MEKRESDIIKSLFDYYEVDSDIRNGQIFMSIVDTISKVLGKKFIFGDYSHVEDYMADIGKGSDFIRALIFDENYQELILSLLESKKYYMKFFIIDLIKELGNAKDKGESEEIIEKYLRLPFIKKIIFNGVDKYCIQTDYGDYSFFLADKVLKDQKLIEYMRKEDRRKYCHLNTTELINRYTDLYSICSLCHHYFEDYYYHSYGYIKGQNKVFDICSNMLMDKSEFDDLYDPKEILFMRNDEIRELYSNEVGGIKSNLGNEGILKCALYMQSLSLEKIMTKRKVLKFNCLTILQYDKIMI